jgi:hypothetical protein
MQYSVAVRNARLDVVETTVGASAILKVRTGAAPATCATADSGTVLATVNLPADWMANAVNGVKSMSGTWEDTAADAAGTAGHFRIYDPAGTVCHIQGTVSMSGGGGDMVLDNTSFAAGQDFIVSSFTLTAGNA